MFTHYFTLARRVLVRNKFFSLINAIGLSMALASAFFIFTYINTELSYDRFHQNASSIFRVNILFEDEGQVQNKSARVSPIVGTVLKENNPSIEEMTKMVILGPDGILSYEDNSAAIRNILLAHQSFFKIFSFPIKAGNPETALSNPFTIMISASIAEQLFGEESPIGKTIQVNARNLDGSAPFEVSGVFEDLPSNTHLTPGVLIAYPTLFEFVGHRFDESWEWNETYTYVKFTKDINTLNEKVDKATTALNLASKQANESKWESKQTTWYYDLQAISSIHLQEGISHEISPSGSKASIWFLGAIAVFILIIAYINYVNLSIVKSLKRIKEVGIRKVVGANRIQLFFQFLMETGIINTLSFVFAGVLVYLFGNRLYSYFDIIPIADFSGTIPFLIIALLFFFALLFACSLYLGLIISAYNPATILKNGKSSTDGSKGKFKTGLIVLQFAASTLFIIATFFIYSQLQYMRNADTGMNLEKILVINTPKVGDYSYDNYYTQFKTEVEKLARIKSVAGAGLVPGEEIFMYNDQMQLNNQSVEGVFKTMHISANYFDQYNISLVAGNSFNNPSRRNQIINETAAKLLGFKQIEEAVGANTSIGTIIGVVADHHHEGLKAAISPTIYTCTSYFNFYSVKLNTNQLQTAIADIERMYKKLFPGSPFKWVFVDELYQRQYEAEERFANMFVFFSGLVIFISCLGFLALTGYSISRRTKEIGIRKTFGASNYQIFLLLTSNFLKYILVAILIAIPLANYLLDEWLDNYAYQIELNWLLFILPSLLVVTIALLTVSIQSFRVANINPAETVRED